MQIKDPNSLLSESELNLLKKCAKMPFALGVFRCLDDILTELNVDVIIEPGIPQRPIPSYLEKAEKYWKKAKENDNNLASPIAEDNIKRIEEEKGIWHSMHLRGLYDPENNHVKLFPEEMQQEDNKHMDELLVSTFAHETMHAYFNRRRDKRPYVLFVEEPLAEFGMLLYLHETKSNFYDWAYNDVSIKKTCYRYGAAFMDNHLTEINNGASDTYFHQMLEEYRLKIPRYWIPEQGSNLFSNGHIFPRTIRNSSIPINNMNIRPKWNRYFYDDSTQTLGMDGDWNIEMIIGLTNFYDAHYIYLHNNFFLRNRGDFGPQRNSDDFDWRRFMDGEFHKNPIDYWDESTKFWLHYFLTRKNVIVSVSQKNKTFYSENGSLYLRNTKRPITDNLSQKNDNTKTHETIDEIIIKAL